MEHFDFQSCEGLPLACTVYQAAKPSSEGSFGGQRPAPGGFPLFPLQSFVIRESA